MLSTSRDAQDAAGLPATAAEVRAIVQPMQSCLERMEGILWELSKDSLERRAQLDTLAGTAVGNSSRSSLNPPDGQQNSQIRKAPDPISLPSSSQSKEAPDPTSLTSSEVMTAVIPSVKSLRDSNQSKSAYSVNEEEEIKGALQLIEHHKINTAFQEFGSKRMSRRRQPIFDKVIALIDRISHSWLRIREPARSNWMFDVTNSTYFETLVQCSILVNSILVAYMADWQIQNIGSEEPQELEVLETIFSFFFLIELILRMGSHRCYFFFNEQMHWNIFDFVLVGISVVDFVLSNISSSTRNSNASFMRLLRMLRLARVFRSLRLFRFFKSLAVLLESFQNSVIPLFWGCVMLCFVLYLFAVIFMEALVSSLQTRDDIDDEEKLDINTKFGSLGRTILSLYMSVTGGEDWIAYADILAQTGQAYFLLYIFFTFFVSFALFNLVTGLLVEKAMSSAKPDRTDLILSQRRKFAEQKSEFLEICNMMDRDKNGKISWSEFQEWVCNPVMIAYMSSIGIDIRDVELFFSTVGARAKRGSVLKKGDVTYERFVEGCMHMKGTATAIDMQRLLFETEMLHIDIRECQTSMMHIVRCLEQSVESGFQKMRSERQPLEISLEDNEFNALTPCSQPLEKRSGSLSL